MKITDMVVDAARSRTLLPNIMSGFHVILIFVTTQANPSSDL